MRASIDLVVNVLVRVGTSDLRSPTHDPKEWVAPEGRNRTPKGLNLFFAKAKDPSP